MYQSNYLFQFFFYRRSVLAFERRSSNQWWRQWCHHEAMLHLEETEVLETSAGAFHAHVGFLWVKPLPHPAMGTRILFCMVLCFLRAGEFPEIKNLQFGTLLVMVVITFFILYSFLFLFRTNKCWSHPNTQTQGDREGARSSSELWTNFRTHYYFLVQANPCAGTGIPDLL